MYDVVADAGETLDDAAGQQAFLERVISDGAARAAAWIDPQWHDTEAGLRAWHDNAMPKYLQTVDVRSGR